MIILLDLDGTLTDTAHEKFKPYKDGKMDFNISEIPIFTGAIEFVKTLKDQGHTVFVVSDSHPKYVKKIAYEIFGLYCSDDSKSHAIWLTDKPNIDKTLTHLKNYHTHEPSIPDISLKKEKDSFLMIGDSWLDIELGRRLNIPTVLTQFYNVSVVEERDGIGQSWKPVKMGPTYYAKTFEDILEIINNPIKELLAVEAIFKNVDSNNMVKFFYRKYDSGFTAFRCLGRQEDGECDSFARADMYYQIDNPGRTSTFIEKLAKAVSNYLIRVEKFPEYKWDYLTYVSDKKTTKPPNKMKEIFDLITSGVKKVNLFKWSDDVEGSLRNKPNYKDRKEFISKYISLIEGIDLKDKSIIIIDDQFTSSATAFEISTQLRSKGVKNILFVALFYLILPVFSKSCPKCSKPLKIKIKKIDGKKFYSCVPPDYGGTGCGYNENIKE
jgi:phosphoglycolate phosphatase-like HAD superfamily hydrolase